jgi:hypothetical protein
MPETVALAKQLHAVGMSYRKISAALAERGHVTGSGKRLTLSITAAQRRNAAKRWGGKNASRIAGDVN